MPEDKLYRMMKRAAQAEHWQQIDDVVDHPVDDVNLLEAWSLGNLSEKTRVELLEHLADCVYCRRETAAMIRDGVLVFPPGAIEPAQEEPELTVARPWMQRVLRILMTVAAVMLVAFGIWTLQPRHQSGGPIAKTKPKFEVVSLVAYGTVRSGGGDKIDTETIIRQAGSDPEKRFDAGLELLKGEKFKAAVEIFVLLDKEFPENAAILNALGVACYHAGKTAEAKKYFDRAKTLDPTNERIQDNIDSML